MPPGFFSRVKRPEHEANHSTLFSALATHWITCVDPTAYPDEGSEKEIPATYISTHSLTSALDGGEWSVSRSSRFTPRERAPGTHWIAGWVGPRTGMDTVRKRKIPTTRRYSNPDRPARRQSLYRLSYTGSSWRSIEEWNYSSTHS
jgi:hypothetical protein